MISKDSFNKINKVKATDEKNNSFLKKIIFSTTVKILIVIILFLSSLIYIKQSDKNKKNYEKIVYNNSLSFAKIYNVYKQYLGDVIPFKNTMKDDAKFVSSEKITYSNIKKENNGYMLTVSNEFVLSSIKSGIVVEKKENETYNNIIKIQDKDGLNITYGCLNNLNVKLYDYVEKGEILGSADKKLYLIFEKDDKYLSYEEYI